MFARQNGFFGLSGLGPGATSSGSTPALSNLVLSQEYRGVSFEVDTDTGSGTLYYVVVPGAAAAPDAEQIEAGTDGGDNAATYAASAVVGGSEVATGIPRVLASDTAYAMYFVQKTGGVYSNVVSDTFTSPLIVASGAYNGQDGDFGTFSNGAITENYADPDGGNNAILVSDNNAGGTGQAGISLGATFINGVNYFDSCIQKVGGDIDGIRFRTANISTARQCDMLFADGSLSSNNFPVTPTVTHLGSGLFRVRARQDMTGYGDLNGAFIIQMIASNSTTIPLDGTNEFLIWNAFISDEATG